MHWLARVPQLALLLALVVFSLTLFLVITSGEGLTQPLNPLLLFACALSVAFLFLAQNPNNENAALLCWVGAGVWGAAAYLNFQMLGLPQLVVALLCAASAFLIERESRVFSFTGPALFIGVGLSLVIIANLLTR